MAGMEVKYLGDLRCEGIHLRSGNTLITDAPIDNRGRGEAFSPSDLLCTSLAACMITIMGIAIRDKEIPITDMKASIEKIMASDPRRVIQVNIQIEMKGKTLTPKQKLILENAALTCPVAKSLHTEITQSVDFRYIAQ